MDVVTLHDLDRLVAGRSEARSVFSIYLPMHRSGPETRQNPIRMKNALDELADRLDGTDVPRRTIEERLEPLRPLVDDYDFWQHQSDGLAIFADGDRIQDFRLPTDFTDFVYAGDRYHVKPLVGALDRGHRFYILALSQNDVRLFGGTRHRISPVVMRDVPTSLAEALWFEDREKQLQHHQGARAGATRTGAVFHGQGLAGEDHERLERFLRIVDRGIADLLEHATAPMVLAGDDRLVDAYRSVAGYPEIVDRSVSGNPEHLDEEELHGAAWPLVADRFDRMATELLDRARTGSEQGLVTSVADAVPAAREGRIAAVVAPRDAHVWGRYDAGRHQVTPHDERRPGDDDLIDLIVALAHQHGGEIHVVDDAEFPVEHDVIASLRY